MQKGYSNLNLITRQNSQSCYNKQYQSCPSNGQKNFPKNCWPFIWYVLYKLYKTFVETLVKEEKILTCLLCLKLLNYSNTKMENFILVFFKELYKIYVNQHIVVRQSGNKNLVQSQILSNNFANIAFSIFNSIVFLQLGSVRPYVTASLYHWFRNVRVVLSISNLVWWILYISESLATL